MDSLGKGCFSRREVESVQRTLLIDVVKAAKTSRKPNAIDAESRNNWVGKQPNNQLSPTTNPIDRNTIVGGSL